MDDIHWLLWLYFGVLKTPSFKILKDGEITIIFFQLLQKAIKEWDMAISLYT